jgi:hypothetical protein
MCYKYLHHCMFVEGKQPGLWCAGCYAEWDHYAHARLEQPIDLILDQLERELRARFTGPRIRFPVEPSAN